MKKVVLGVSLLAAVLTIAGCATPYPLGLVVTQVEVPAAGGDGTVSRANLKKGVSECKSYLGIVACGDASIETAAKNGGITQIHYVDWEVDNILGFIGTYRCVVYGR
jgi:hypothetical protein